MKPSHLIHLAWEAVPPACYVSINNYYWLTSSISLIQHFTTCGGKRVVVAGLAQSMNGLTVYYLKIHRFFLIKPRIHYVKCTTLGSKRTPSKPVSACVGAAFFICMALTNKGIDSFLTSSLLY